MTTLEILKQYFGYDSFRDGQDTIVNGILAGNDVLGIMPTGAGKSLCFQIPALMTSGLTLIVSPLISLMKDQVNALTQSGIAAAYINSSLTERQVYKALQNAKAGNYKLIYVAPERLLAPDFLTFAQSVEISMLTVDEAHCISQWGQDFRPSYAKIPDFIANLEKRPILSAFTATATPRVREDIVNLLGLQEPIVLVTGFDRKNLYFEVQKPKDKFSALMAFLEDKKELNGIVYCTARATVEEVCERLKQEGYNSSRYHAGLPNQERHDNQDDFLYDRVQIMVATNAFGMGIDKSNVSFVVHYNMPKDLESYYQEAGRAGRDGEPADCILLYSGKDVRTNLWLIENARDIEYPDKDTEEMLKERDRRRLREMTFYCATKDCLRRYVLEYFGEQPPRYCGNCGSCNTNFETVDITVESQKILSCVVRMKERHGQGMVIDVLCGSKNEKVMRLGFDKLSTYGISEMTENQLREIISHLTLNGYLLKTDSEYPLLKLGQHANDILFGDAAVHMKLSKKIEQSSSGAEKNKLRKSDMKPVDKRLFDDLKATRLAIANEQKVPAFAIFSDSTLVDMCMKLPLTNEDFLMVSGVGQVKLERYGRKFLGVIRDFTENNDLAEMAPETPKAFDASLIEVSENAVTVSMVADRMNCVLMECGYGKVSGKRINDWLVSKGYMRVVSVNGKNVKLPTDAGTAVGIISEEREIRSEIVKMNLYGMEAQRLVAQNALEIEMIGR